MAKAPVKNATAKAAPKMGAAAPKAADAPKVTTPAEQTTAAPDTAKPAGDGVTETPTPQTQAPAPADEGKAKAAIEAAYQEGYSNGFSAALDDQAERQAEQGNGDQDDGGLDKYAAGTATADYGPGSDYMRQRLVTLALFTPSNQRKGGLFVVVDRLQQFVDSLPPEEHDAALMFMSAVAQTTPIDLASGKFKMLVTEALAAVNGETTRALDRERPDQRGEAAAARLAAAMPDLDEQPDDPDLPPAAEVDMDDPDSAASAAARLNRL